MNKNDPNTYYFNQQSYDSSSDIFPPGRGYMHKHGNEIECNLEGKYVTMVSYMSEEAGNDYQFSICSVGLFGYPQIYYVRDEPLPATLEVFQGDFPTRLIVPNIYAENGAYSVMDINLRQAEEDSLSFVSIEELVGETAVTIAASQLIVEADY